MHLIALTQLKTTAAAALMAAIALSGALLPGVAGAAIKDLVFGKAITELEIPVNQSRILVLDDPIHSISIGNPSVADIVVLESRKIHVVGRALGSTNVVISSKIGPTNHYTTFAVQVTHDLDGLKNKLHELMPFERPEVRSAQGAIVISGEASSVAKVEAIVSLAKHYVQSANRYTTASKTAGTQEKDPTTPDVVNLMQVGGPHQVVLEVKVAEISRKALKHMGINLAGYNAGRPFKIGAVNGGAQFPEAYVQSPVDPGVPLFPNDQALSNLNDSLVGPAVQKFMPTMPAIASTGLFASFLGGSSYINMVIDAYKDDGVAKVLAEPTLTALSGESAQFLSGGEFPVPIPGDNNKVQIIFKPYGVGVKMLPIVLDSKRINLSLNVSVSELSNLANITSGVPGSNVSFSIPSLTSRSASSTVEIADGQTIGIAGLISDKLRENINKFPGLGDVPILGALFRSQSFLHEESELVMFVTAHLAKPIAPDKIRLPTDSFVNPNDTEFFLLGLMEGRDKKPNAKLKVAANSSRQIGRPIATGGPNFGHQI